MRVLKSMMVGSIIGSALVMLVELLAMVVELVMYLEDEERRGVRVVVVGQAVKALVAEMKEPLVEIPGQQYFIGEEELDWITYTV